MTRCLPRMKVRMSVVDHGDAKRWEQTESAQQLQHRNERRHEQPITIRSCSHFSVAFAVDPRLVRSRTPSCAGLRVPGKARRNSPV